MKFVLSKFKVSLLAMNHLFITVRIWFHNSKRQITSCSVVVIKVSSANVTGIVTVSGMSLICKRKGSPC
jgi:hypothetical protein